MTLIGRLLASAWPYRAASLAGSLVAQLAAAALAGPNVYGRFATLLAAAQLASLVVKSGYDVLLLRLGAGGDPLGQVRVLGWRLVQRAVVVTAVAGGVWWLVDLPTSWLLAIPLTLGVVALRFSEAVTRVARLDRLASITQLLALVVFVVAVALDPASLVRMVGAFSLANAVLAAVAVVVALRRLRRTTARPTATAGSPDAPLTGEARWIGVTGGLTAIIGESDTLLVAWLFGPALAGAYSIAWRLASLVAVSLTIENFVQGGALGRSIAGGRHGDTQALLTRSSRRVAVGAALALPTAVVAAAGATAVLGYGAELLVLTALLAGSQLANALGGPVSLLLSLARKPRALARLLAAAAVVNLVSSVGLALVLGYPGIALGTLLAQLFLAVGGVRSSAAHLGHRIGYAALRDGRAPGQSARVPSEGGGEP